MRVQITWEDKSFYLPSRSPASAACLREWRTAPPGSGERLFQWKGSAPLYWLGAPLERHHLSVFGRHRTYLLQGDLAVGRVSVAPPGSPAFVSHEDHKPADPNDFHRLDLVLAPDTGVAWRVDLPPGARIATFSSVVRTVPGESQSGRAAHVSVMSEESPVRLDGRAFLSPGNPAPLSLDLSPLAGKRITLRLTAEETPDFAAPLVFEAPKIELRLDR